MCAGDNYKVNQNEIIQRENYASQIQGLGSVLFLVVYAISLLVSVSIYLYSAFVPVYCQTPDLPNSPVQLFIGKSGRLYIRVVVRLVG